MQVFSPLDSAVQFISVLSLPAHCTLSSHIFPVPSLKLAELNASAPVFNNDNEVIYEAKL